MKGILCFLESLLGLTFQRVNYVWDSTCCAFLSWLNLINRTEPAYAFSCLKNI